jgi:hypothetical protein
MILTTNHPNGFTEFFVGFVREFMRFMRFVKVHGSSAFIENCVCVVRGHSSFLINRVVWKPQFPNNFHTKCGAFCGLVR